VSQKVNFLGQGNKGGSSRLPLGEERANILLLACCYQEGWPRAGNLGNLWRRLVLPKKIENWSLTSLQQRLVKTGGRLVKHARYYWLMLAESHLTRRLFGGMVRRIDALGVPAG
jgi:hypothetical protein